jgi:hypothetical protein
MISAPPGPCPSGLHRPERSSLYQVEPLWPTKLAIHSHSQSLPGHAPKACQSGEPQAHMISASPGCNPRPAKPAIHRQAQSLLSWVTPLRLAKPVIHRQSRSTAGCAPETCAGQHDLSWATTPRSAKPAIHRHTQSPLHWAFTLQVHQAHGPKAR